jgi:magnesium chelatase accessory protein
MNTTDPPLDWPNRSASRLLECGSMRWHLQDAGQGPVILLLHGTAGSTHQWADVIPRLTPHARVIAPDLPGHGFTHVPRGLGRDVFSLAGMAAAVGELLYTLAVTPALIVGHSAGAAVSLRLTLDGLAAPQALIGCNPALVAPPDAYVAHIAPLLAPVVESRLLAGLAARLAGGTRLIDTMLDSSGSALTDTQRGFYRTLCARDAHVAAALTMMSRWDLPTLLRDARALAVPFVALAGDRDRWVPLEPLRDSVARIPGATFRLIPHVGHLLPDEAPEIVIDVILDQLRSTPPAAALAPLIA